MAELRRGRPGLQHLPAPTRCVSRLGRGRGRPSADCPPEVAEVLALGEQAERESGGAFASVCRAPDGGTRARPERRGEGLGRRAGRRRAARPGRTPTSASPPAATWSAARSTPAAAPWRIGVEDPHDPQRLVAVVPVRTGAVATSGTAHRGAHLVDARTGQAAGRRRLGHRRRGRPSPGPTSTRPRRSPAAPTPPAGCAPGRAAPGWWCGPTGPRSSWTRVRSGPLLADRAAAGRCGHDCALGRTARQWADHDPRRPASGSRQHTARRGAQAVHRPSAAGCRHRGARSTPARTLPWKSWTHRSRPRL